MARQTSIVIPAEKSGILRDLGHYPTPLLQWFLNSIDGYTALNYAARGEMSRVTEPDLRVTSVMYEFALQATADVRQALGDLYDSVWAREHDREARSSADHEYYRASMDKHEPADAPVERASGQPKGWDVWSPAERVAWNTEQSAWQWFDEACDKATRSEAGLNLKLHDGIQEAAAHLHAAISDRQRALLERWRPDLTDLIELAFEEESEREDNLQFGPLAEGAGDE